MGKGINLQKWQKERRIELALLRAVQEVRDWDGDPFDWHF